MADRRIFGAAWLDQQLCPVERFGSLTDELRPGVPITQSVAALMGFDEEIQALVDAPDRSVTVPNVRIPGSEHADERLSYAVQWVADEKCHVLLVACAFSRFDLEYRLAAESRARSIAEAEVAAQARLIERANRELAAANRDLAEFASVISHDLRAPLRGLRYAVEDARSSLGHGEHEQATAQIDKALGQARRMSRMLTSLLAYARAGRKTDEIETIDTGVLAAEIAHSIGAASTQSVAIEGEWPTLETLAEPLDIVLRNLIDNAVKHHDRDDGRIVVSA
ncbi:MAG: hypothetical protein JSS20_05775, partial [Proteobacteria bacterium]|nr:hypothetical protein [Pseudomonadota bacterium]